MDRRRVERELAAATTGNVVGAVLAEVAMIPADRQDPRLVAAALSLAQLVGDPESALVAPEAFSRLSVILDRLHEEAGDV